MQRLPFYRSFFHFSYRYFLIALLSFVAGAFIGGAVALPGHTSYELWRDQGSALGGLLALGAGLLAYFAGARQAQAAREQLDDVRTSREAQSAGWLQKSKAALHLPLIEIHNYSKQCFTAIETILNYGFQIDDNIVKSIVNVSKCKPSPESIIPLQDVLLYCEREDAGNIAVFLSLIQIQHSRIESVKERVNPISRVQPVAIHDVVNCIRDTLLVVAWGNACLRWARNDGVHIAPPSNEDLARLPSVEFENFPSCRRANTSLGVRAQPRA